MKVKMEFYKKVLVRFSIVLAANNFIESTGEV